MIIIALKVIFFCNCVFAQWLDPKFLANQEVSDQVQFQQTANGPTISMDEGINDDIIIAFLNYKGANQPVVSKIIEPSSTSGGLLGAVLVRDSIDSNWELVITSAQDYERTPIRYIFEVKVDDKTEKVFLSVNNLDNKPPIINTNADNNPCKIEENYEGSSSCIYTISDDDGIMNNIVTYTLSSTIVNNIHETFQIIDTAPIQNGVKEWTVQLEVLKKLDYEELPSYILDFTAMDSGNNKYTVKIEIEVIDLPDTPPVWRKILSSARIPEKEIWTSTVQATDGDVGIKAPIQYKIVSDWNDLFKIGEDSGIITVEKIDRDTLQNELFSFEVIAYEKDDPTSSTSQTITIVVQDINDHKPIITLGKSEIEIPESQVTTLDVNVDISDLDLGNNAKYKVSLVESIYSKAFQIVPSSAYQNATFSISVVNSELLDFENPDWREFTLTIHSEEDYNNTQVDEKTLTVRLINWNDESPIFQEPEYTKNIPEGIGKDYELITVLAIDSDVGDSINYSLLGTEIQRLFSIDNNGIIRTITDNTLDYEKQSVVFIQVQAEDTLAEPYHKTIAPVTIQVQDVNDEQPRISVETEPITIVENQVDGTLINTNTAITATDEDTESLLEFSIDWKTSYAVKNGQQVEFKQWISVETEFISTTKTAQASLKVLEADLGNTPDYELFDTMYITLVVTDKNQIIGKTTNQVQLTITIQDFNDNSPIFIQDTVSSAKNVIEGAEADTRIGIITAQDADGPENNQIVYSIEPIDSTPTGWIEINPTSGELFVPKDAVIDADLPIYKLKYTVLATNDKNVTPADITITVIDRNNKPPTCTFLDTVHIKEKAPNATKLSQTLNCIDGDRDDAYKTPWFRLNSFAVEVKNLFSIDQFTGDIYVDIKGDQQLDRDDGPAQYTIPFIVSDNYDQVGTVQQNPIDYVFTLILDDINDHAPIIETTTISGKENMLSDTTLGDIIAKDKDAPATDNTRMNFEIISITKGSDAGADPPSDLFSIIVEDEFLGKGKFITNYNLEGYYGTYITLVKAFDYGTDPEQQTSEKSISVNIEKYNFKPPVFKIPSPENNKPIYLAKNQKIDQQLYQYDGSLLQNFKVSDQQNEKWDIKITITEQGPNVNEVFSLKKSGRSEAMLVLNSIQDFGGTYVIKLNADCDCIGEEPHSTSLSINVRFIDNESEPEFEIPNAVSLDFPENSTDIEQQLPKAYFNKEGEDWDLFTPHYFLTEDPSGAFEVDKTSAILKLVKVLDREEVSSLTLKVVSSKNPDGNLNPSESSILTVSINVVDINDNPPGFDRQEFYGGITPSLLLNAAIFDITASDLDIKDSLDFHVLPETLKPFGTGIDSIETPFVITSESGVSDNHIIGTGTVHLNFTILPSMSGYFTFDVEVLDQANHKVTAPVKIYIVSESSQIIFQFSNTVTVVKAKEEMLRRAFEQVIGYRCNIESIVASDGNSMSNQTDVVVHFVNQDTNEAISNTEIKQILADYKVYQELYKQLNKDDLVLISFNNNELVQNSEEELRAWLIGVSVVLGTLCLIFIVALIVKTRSLTSRLNKLSKPKFGSQESGLNRIGLKAPNTNKHAIEGSNPVYSEEKKIPEFDRQSIGSGDSDLIGIEDNPNFDYDIKARNSVDSLFKEKL